LNLPQDTLDAVLEDWTIADIPERTRAALRLLETMTRHPLDINPGFVEGLYKDGLDDFAIREAANVGFHYNLINRVADAFDFPTPEGVHKKRLASMLNFTSKLLRGSIAEEVWVRSKDGVIRPPEVELGRERFLTVGGATDPALRLSVEAFVTEQWEYFRNNAEPVPSKLKNYLKKLSLHAYRIIDEDINALRVSGYSDEAIYEITMVGSVAAALVGLEKLYLAMYASEKEH
jgi:alkylhydroperoxidase family enzyme